MLLRAAWALLVLAHAAPIRGPRAFGVWRQDSPPGRPSTVNCTWQSFRQQIDHFGSKKGTFPQRVCIYSRWWKDASQSGFNASGSPGPIFFYTGNESPVEQYINNTGLMWELAEKMGALIVFAEHRYEPLSHPRLCGTENCVAYCTTAQALADWAAIIADLRKQHVARAPAVVFGGSYGGMLSGWMRMKYPEVVDGAIAASAPIWQLATTVTKKSLDWPARAVARGVSKPGKAPDRCLANLRVAWPLLEAAGSSQEALELLSQEVNTCRPLKSAKSFTSWAQQPYFLLAEGNYPYPSTYITFAVGPGDIPLPAWPMREACKHLDRDFGVELEGSLSEVRYNATLGDLKVTVDWTHLQSNSAGLTLSRLVSSNLLALARGVANAAGVWYNVSGTKRCWDVEETSMATEEVESAEASPGLESSADCAACPPCPDCPPCPLQRCNQSAVPCNFTGTLPNTFSWDAITCNDDLSQIEAQGLGRDLYWPPSVPSRNFSVASVVGPKGLRPGCGRLTQMGLQGAPVSSDPWSGWMTAYYGGRDVSQHRNVVWSNGALDPWSGQGVYPPDGGPEGPMVQNISEDGSQIALVLDLGAHHLDLMFSDPRDPPCAKAARQIEAQRIRSWCQEAYDRQQSAPLAAREGFAISI